MFRNKEFKLLLFVMGTIGFLSTFAVSFFSTEAALIMIITTSLLLTCTLLFTAWRYREIEKLSSYLRKISAGDYALDVRDNKEGELSILKNDIYKVTLMLSEQSSHLQKDKGTLTDAISDISHQLKTPITSMVVMTDLIRDENLQPAKRSEFTRNIRVQLERIEWLVSSLLKLSKIDAGTIQFKKNPIQVKDLVKKAVTPLLIPMDIKEQTLSIKGDDSVTFLGDLNWTTEALINIVKNAVEHTPHGGELEISFSENPLFTEIVITDNGKGISKEELPYIFKRFFKGKNAGEETVGIGLAMTQTIVTSQNGTIDVQSEVGKGTKFRLKFYKQVL
ncbi:signal transduction histidine kinase [Evansella vedderi]|uniref:histidine kinase n=1 Tax=Evansella vedderi TaxID=38282 RepID=A0ABT9ZSV9_9BACI|nr:HAMP domain-containing sensor histidine kinase [Evansella vedderi]MDQ0253568.1 signal transduction histidine kinase [Evansella vedderi]